MNARRDDNRVPVLLGVSSVDGTTLLPIQADNLGRLLVDVPGGTGSPNWGDIGGTLSAQTDLQNALNAKADTASLATVATSGLYSDLSGTPSLATVATTGDYDDLINKPTIPTVPGTKNSVEVDAGDYQLVGDAASPGNLKYYGTNGSGIKGFHDIPTGGTVNWGDIGGTLSAQTDLQNALNAKADTSSLAAVATSGDYADIINTPSLAGFLVASNNLSDLTNASTARTNLGLVIGTNVQAYSATLDSWASKSVPTGDAVGTTDTQTLTNKRINPRVQSVASSATVTPNADTDDCVDITAQAVALTIANPSGTPVNFQKLIIRIRDDSTTRTINFGTDYSQGGIALPTATTANKTLVLGFMYNTANSLNKWQLIALTEEQ